VKSRRWKWIGLGAIAAIAVGTAVVVQQRRRRQWQNYDAGEIRERLHERFVALDEPIAERPDATEIGP
jgi:hypothetical protein